MPIFNSVCVFLFYILGSIFCFITLSVVMTKTNSDLVSGVVDSFERVTGMKG